MKELIKKIVVLFSFVLISGCTEDGLIGLEEYGSLTGKVVEKDGFEPIANAKVTLSPGNNTTFTDANGDFKFEKVIAQDYSVQASKDGFLDTFEPAQVTKDGTVNVVIEMDISTALNQAPSVPDLLSPNDLATGLENKVELIWTSKDPDEDVLTYRILIKNNFNSEEIEIQQESDTTLTIESLRFGAKYFWQVGVSDGINDEVLSGTRSFTVKDDPKNRYFFVRNVDGNNVVYSANFNETSLEEEDMLMLTDSGKNSWRPRKSNTANLVAFLQTSNNETHIFTMKTNGDNITKVTSSVPVTAFNLNEVDFSWSPDGSKFVYPSFDKLYIINKDGSGLQMIHQTLNGNLITECDWSADGSKIAVKTNNSNGYNGDIYVINTSGAILTNVVTGSIGALGGLNFSVTGNRLLYTKDVSDFQSSNYRQLDTHIFIYDIVNDSTIDLSLDNKTSGTNDLDPRFSPNEAEIIFVNTSNDGVSQRNVFRTSSVVDDNVRAQLFINALMPDWE